MTKSIRQNLYFFAARGLSVRFVLCFFGLFFINITTIFAQATSQANGDWNTPATWVGNIVPTAGQNVTINHLVNISTNTATVANVVVNNNLSILNIASSTLTYNGTMTVNANATLNNYGGIAQVASSNRTFTLGANATYLHNPRNVTFLDESIFVKGNEVFNPTSHLIIQKWFDTNVPLGALTRVNGDFGNVTMNIPDVTPWEQFDEFMTGAVIGRVLGTLTVSSGIVRMCDGSAASTYMDFNDIMIDGTGSIVFISGPSRPFVLTTNNFTDNSTSPNPTIIMDNVFALRLSNHCLHPPPHPQTPGAIST